MNNHTDIEKHDDRGGHGGHGIWVMVACCVPMIVILALLALKVI